MRGVVKRSAAFAVPAVAAGFFQSLSVRERQGWFPGSGCMPVPERERPTRR